MTPVMAAVHNGNIELVKYLLDQGADALAKNEFGGTAYTVARSKGKKELTAILKSYSVPLEDQSPYRIMVHLIYKAIVRYIRYATYKVRYYTGMTPFDVNEEL